MIESTSDHRYHERGWTRPMPRTARKVTTHDVWAAGLNARIVERVTAAVGTRAAHADARATADVEAMYNAELEVEALLEGLTGLHKRVDQRTRTIRGWRVAFERAR